MTPEERVDAFCAADPWPSDPCGWTPDYCGLVRMVEEAEHAATLRERERILKKFPEIMESLESDCV